MIEHLDFPLAKAQYLLSYSGEQGKGIEFLNASKRQLFNPSETNLVITSTAA
jgi:hypothetical protein